MPFGSSSSVARAVGVIAADIGPWKKGLAEAESDLKKTTGRMGAVQKAAGIAGGAGLAALAVGTKKSVEAYMEAEKSQAKMVAQLKASGIAYEQHRKQIDDTIKKQSELSAFDDEDLTDSFTNLVRTTGDVTEALKLNATAADIARAKGMSLESASKLLQKAYNGSAGAAKKLGIEIEPVTTAQDKLEASTKKATDAQKDAAKRADETATKQKILAELQGTFAGQAEAYGETGAGAAERLQVATENLFESMGTLLAPVIEKISNLLAGLAGWAERNRGAFQVLIGVFAAVSAGLVAFSVIGKVVEAFKLLANVTKIVTAAQWLLNIALDANPIGIIVVGIAALVAGLILAYKHSENFRKIVDAMWAGIRPAFEWIREHWKLVLAVMLGGLPLILIFKDKIIGAFRAIKDAIVNAWNVIKNAVTAGAGWIKNKAEDIVGFVKGIPGKIGNVGEKVWGKLKTGWEAVKTFVSKAASSVVKFITDIPGKIGDIGSQIGQKILGGLRSVWNGIAAIINKGIDAFNFLPGPDIGHIPNMQRGGIIQIPPGTSYGVDGIPAVIAPGEAVMTVAHQMSAAQMAGQTLQEWRNAVGLNRVMTSPNEGRGFATGGYYYPLASHGAIIGTPHSGTHTLGNWMSDNAWDISAPIGTPIVAFSSGSWSPSSFGGPPSSRFGGWGAYFSGVGGQAYYKHMISVAPAGHYQGGSVLGKSGAGNSVPHLHIGFLPQSLGNRVLGGAIGGKPIFDTDAHAKYLVKHGRYMSELKNGKAFQWGGYFWGQGIGNGEKDFKEWWQWKHGGKLTGYEAWKKKYPEAAWLLTHNTAKPKPKPPKKPPKPGGGGGGGGGSTLSGTDTTPEMNETTQAQVDAYIEQGGWVAGINAPTPEEFKVMVSGAKKDKDKRTDDEKYLFDKYSDWRAYEKSQGVDWWKKQYSELGIAKVAPPEDQPTPPPPASEGEEGTGGSVGDGGETGGTGDGGGGGPTQAEIEAQIQERLRAEENAIWGARQGFYTDLGSNIFSPSAGGMTMGSTAGTAGVTVVQNFNRPPEDQFANMKRAERAASAAFGK